MKYSTQEVLQFIQEDDVKFIRLAFCDIYGRQKNISIMPYEIEKAFEKGIPFDASAIQGFGGISTADLLLHPDPETLAVLPWRPEHGKVVRMYCTITYADGRPFEYDSRAYLINTISKADSLGYHFSFGAVQEFYLFQMDENGNPTKIPYDNASYMDIAPDDKGENVRREVALTLEQMGIQPESSCHEEGPGQNKINYRYSDPLHTADNVLTFQTVVKTVAFRNGLSADFSPKPLPGKPGNGFHINLSVSSDSGADKLNSAIAGIMSHINEMTAFLSPTENSYKRLGSLKAPGYITWSHENRFQLIRIPETLGDHRRAELRSSDPMSNPYLAFALIIEACIDGIERELPLPEATDVNLYNADIEELSSYKRLPGSLKEAKIFCKNSDFMKAIVSKAILSAYTK